MSLQLRATGTRRFWNKFESLDDQSGSVVAMDTIFGKCWPLCYLRRRGSRTATFNVNSPSGMKPLHANTVVVGFFARFGIWSLKAERSKLNPDLLDAVKYS